jgi:DNA-binding NtrC family response regulator
MLLRKTEREMIWPPQVLIVATECSDRDRLQKIFSQCGVHCFCYSTLMEAQPFLSGQPVSAVFAEDRLPDGDLRAILAGVNHFQKDVPIVVLSRHADWDSYIAIMAAGAFDCLAFPPGTLEAKRVLWSALQSFSTAQHHQPVAV